MAHKKSKPRKVKSHKTAKSHKPAKSQKSAKSHKTPAKRAPKKSSKRPAGGGGTHGVADYGVLRGVVVQHGREDDDPQTPHLQVIVEADGERWRCAINVLSSAKKASDEEKQVRFAIVNPLASHPILSQLDSLEEGFTPLPAQQPGLTLDFVREPLFDLGSMQHLPFFGPGQGDDLQDLMEVFVNKAEGKPADVAEVFVWGSRFSGGSPRPADKKFKTRKGVHNVHMNQGNPPGQFFGDNGLFHDGGLIFRFTNPNRFVGIFLRFESQSVPTDDRTGAPLPRVPEAIEVEALPAVAAWPPLVIVGAVVHPAGEQVGNETVTILNTLSSAVNLTGWTLEDRDGNPEPLDGLQLRGGESKLIVLTGAGARLGDDGGAITLKNKDGVRVQSVTYSREEAAELGRTIVF